MCVCVLVLGGVARRREEVIVSGVTVLGTVNFKGGWICGPV